MCSVAEILIFSAVTYWAKLWPGFFLFPGFLVGLGFFNRQMLSCGFLGLDNVSKLPGYFVFPSANGLHRDGLAGNKIYQEIDC